MSRRAVLKAVGTGVAVGAVGTAAGQAPAAAAGSPAARRLRDALGSRVLFPGEPGYDVEHAAFNTLVQQYPNAIVVARDASDVALAVRIAGTELGWPIAVQSTGHGVSVPADGALLINMREMKAVTADAVTRTARIGGGARWRDVLVAAAPLGLLPPVGSTSDVGSSGYVSGGGVPIIGRTYGYAADRVRAIDLVTPDGRRRRLSPEHEPDLFWAVRGGESNFGVITALEIDLVPAATVYGGSLVFPAAAAARVYREYLGWCTTVSDRMTSGATFVRLPGQPQALKIEAVYVGPAAGGARELAPLRMLQPVADTVADVPVARIDTIFNAPTTPSASVGLSGLMGTPAGNGVDLLLDTVGFAATLPSGFVEFRQLGGRYQRTPASPNAIGHRDAEFLLFLNNPVPDPQSAGSVERTLQAIMARLGPILSDGRIPTFLGPQDTGVQTVRSAYEPATWARLLAIKHRYDPHNLFRFNHNIR